jgi:hypothetical protein
LEEQIAYLAVIPRLEQQIAECHRQVQNLCTHEELAQRNEELLARLEYMDQRQTSLDVGLSQRYDHLLGKQTLVEDKLASTLTLCGQVQEMSLPQIMGDLAALPLRMENQLLAQDRRLLFSLSQKFRDVVQLVRDTVMSPSGALVRAIRSASKAPAMKRSRDLIRFPDDQKASPVELHLECEPLVMALFRLLKRPEPTLIFSTGIDFKNYRVWKVIRSGLGRNLAALRAADGLLDRTHPEFCERPKMWSNEAVTSTGGTGETAGQRYVYLREQLERYLPLALRASVRVRITELGNVATSYNSNEARRPGAETMSRRLLIDRLLREDRLPPEDWPISDLDGSIPPDEEPLEEDEVVWVE